MEISAKTAISVVFAVLLTLSLIAMPVLAAGPDSYRTERGEDGEAIYRTNGQSIYGANGHPFVSPDATGATDGATRATSVDVARSPAGGPPLGPVSNGTIDREAILENTDLSPELLDRIDSDGVAFPDGRDSTARVASVEKWNGLLSAASTDEYAYNTSVEALLAAYGALDELDIDEKWADELGNVTASLNATADAYRSANRVESVAAYENATDAQEELWTLAQEFDAAGDDPLENASDDLSEATQRTAELAVSDGYRVVETYNETIYDTDAYNQARFKLVGASLALAAAEQMRNESIPENTSAENESVYRMGRTVLATYFEQTAWMGAQRAIDVVAAEVEPSLTVNHRRPVEIDGSILVPIEAQLSGVRPYSYDAEVVLEGDSEPVALSLGGGQPPGSIASGVAPVEVDGDADTVNVTVTASRADENRTVSASGTIDIEPDEVVPDRPDPDEPQEVQIDDESGASVTARGTGLHASDVRVTTVTPDANASAYASPIVDVHNERSFENATVAIPFDASRLDEENLSIVHFGTASGEGDWQALETDLDEANATASANVTSFSRFAVMDSARIEGSTSAFIDPGWPILEDFGSLSGWETVGSVTNQDTLAFLETDPRDDGGGDDPDPDPGPVARISGPSVLEYAETGTWSAADSSGVGLSYQWGGDVDGSGQTVSDSFGMAPSTQQITLTVTDAEGRSDTTSQDVDIICPSGTCPEPYEVNETTGVESDFSTGSTDVHTSTMSRTFSIDEGVESAELKTSVLADVDPVGAATITVTGEDGDSRVLFERGEPGAPDGPVASISGPSEVEFAETNTWSGEESLGDGLSYEWSGDVGGTGPSVSKTFYEAPANKQITLTVTDDEGRSDETTQNVDVFCPSASCPEPYEANATNTALTTHSGTWQDVSADISEFAGEEVTVTFEATDGAALSTEYVSVLTDAEGSGVPDVAEELDLHMPASGEGRHLFSPLNLDPTVADTDGDGLRDGEEVTVVVNYRSADSGGKLRASVRTARSHPARVDTTGDGLTDTEQIEGWRVNYATSRQQTLDFLAALEDADDIGDLDDGLLETDTVDADPLVNDTDSDGLSDVQEVRYGTDPESADTTGDGISDGEALSGAYDPTLFDIEPPSIDVWDADFHKPRWSLEGTYYTHYYVQDPAGLAESQVLHDGDVEETYPLDGTPGEPIESEVELGRLETIGDMFSGGTMEVTAEDRNGNEVQAVAYEQTNVWGQIAEELRAQDLSHPAVERHLGALSGMTTGAGEAYGFLLALYKNPRETIAAMTQIVDAIVNLDEVIASLPDSIREQQERNNPHEPGTDLHDAYRQGWYKGYISWFVIEAAVPTGQVSKAAKNSDRFQNLADDLSTSEIRRAAELAGRAKHGAAAPVRYSKSQLSRGLAASADVSREVGSRLLRAAETSGQLLRRTIHASNLEDETLELLADGSGEVAEGYRQATLRAADGDAISSYRQIDRAVQKIDELEGKPKLRAQRLVRSTGGDGIRLVDELDDDAFDAFVRMESNPGFEGVSGTKFDLWRANVAVGSTSLDAAAVRRYVDNMDAAGRSSRITNEWGLGSEVVDSAGKLKGKRGEAASAVRYADDGAEVDVEPGNGDYDLEVVQGGQTEYVEVKTRGLTKEIDTKWAGGQFSDMNKKYENAKNDPDVDLTTSDQVLELRTNEDPSRLGKVVDEVQIAVDTPGGERNFNKIRIVMGDGHTTETIPVE